MTKAEINRKLKPLGVTIQGKRGAGYFYLLNELGDQVGDSCYVMHLYQLTIEQWFDYAKDAIEQNKNSGNIQ